MRGRPAGCCADDTVSCSRFSADARIAVRKPRDRAAARRRPLRGSRGRGRARHRSAPSAGSRRSPSSSSGFRTNTFDRDSSAAFTSNDGFSVVAPISTMSPLSTRGRNASCCALLKRWISSTNTMVRLPVMRRRCSAVGHDVLDFLDAGQHGAEGDEIRACVRSAIRRASVVLPVPGGPHRMIDCSRSRSIISRSGRPGCDQIVLADDLVERSRPHPLGERNGLRIDRRRFVVEEAHRLDVGRCAAVAPRTSSTAAATAALSDSTRAVHREC